MIKFRSKQSLAVLISSVILSSVTACTSTNVNKQGLSGELNLTTINQVTNSSWQAESAIDQSDFTSDWLTQLGDDNLTKLVNIALKSNTQLQQQALAVSIKKLQLANANASFWPELAASLSQSRQKSASSGVIANGASASLTASYELDLWGKLSASSQKATLDYLAQQASFEQAKQTLVADVATAWFSSISAKKLWQLTVKRTENIKQNLSIIESGYKQGLNSSLDVYLTRNQLNSALASVAKNKESFELSLRTLSNLLSRFPVNNITLSDDFPEKFIVKAIDTPSNLVERKPELKASWYQLLAADASLAIAHKQRFPRISLSASLSNTDTDLGQLISNGTVGWSLLGNITAPIFQAGKLKNTEDIARLSLKQSEQQYLSTLYNAFLQVENKLTADVSIAQQRLLQEKARANAESAYKLSFEQYNQGIVSYTTVLDAQNRWYDAQISLIQLNKTLITNRIALYLALGGNF